MRDSLVAIYNFGVALGVSIPVSAGRRISVGGLLANFEEGGTCYSKLTKLYDDPRTLNVSSSSERFYFSSRYSEFDLSNALNFFKNTVSSSIAELRKNVRKLLLNLVYPASEDCFDKKNMTILLSARIHRVTSMSSPLLKDEYGFMAVSTQRRLLSPGAVLFHELSHCFSMVLEKRKDDRFLPETRKVLFDRIGFSREYLSGMRKRWSDTEELRAIIGVVVEGKSIFYDYLNESEFNLAAGIEDGVRVSHVDLYFTRVPYYLLEFIEAGHGKTLTKVRREIVRNYDSAIDCI